MLKIGEFSKLSRISIRMLRYYDEMGLLVLETIDPFTGYRYYSEAQLFAAGRITALKEMGFKLCDTAELLKHWEDRETLEQHFLARREETRLQAEEAARRLRLLDTALERLRKDEPMKYDVTVRTIPERHVASAVCKGSYEQMGEAIAEVVSWVESGGYVFDGPSFFIYHVSPHETNHPEEFVTELCYPVRKKQQ